MPDPTDRHRQPRCQAGVPRLCAFQPARHRERRRSQGRSAVLERGLACALAALLAFSSVASPASAQPGTFIVELSEAPGARRLPASARRTGAAGAAQRVAHLRNASAAASAEQSSFHNSARAARVPYRLLHTYRYVSLACVQATHLHYCFMLVKRDARSTACRCR